MAERTAANRRNAARSTGPRTPAGKAKAAANALRHGLSLPSLRLPEFAQAVHALADRLAAAEAGAPEREQALIVAEATIDLRRVRVRKAALLSELEHVVAHPGPDAGCRASARRIEGLLEEAKYVPSLRLTRRDRAQGLTMMAALLLDRTPRDRARLLKALAGLERYERRALSRRDGALRHLAALRDAQPDETV